MNTKSYTEPLSDSLGEKEPDIRNGNSEPIVPTELPAMDKGFHAWAYLVSAYFLELIVWSIPFSYGVFLNYYTTVVFQGNDNKHVATLLPVIGTLSTGVIYISSFPVSIVVGRYPQWRPILQCIGLGMTVLSLVGASFSTKSVHLLVTQGLLYPIGGAIIWLPAMSILPEWFSAKRGLANGVVFSGTGLGGTVLPFVIEYLLRHHGQRWTFLILAMIFLALALPTLIYGKSRMPPKQQAISGSMKPKVTFYRNGVFWVFLAANILQSFAFFLPGIYLPSFAHDLGLSTISGALLVALMNGVSVPGIIGIGLLSDAYDLRWCIILSTTGPALAILLVWGLSKNIATLLIFACIYGPLAGGFSSMWPKIIEIVAGGRADSQTYSTLFSIFNASRGLGNVLSGLVAAKLIEHSPLEGKTSFGYGLMGYGSLILFTGGCMLASTIAVAYPLFRGPLMEPPNGPNPVPVSERDVNQNETV